MADMADMLRKMEKAAGKHDKIRSKIEALKKQMAEEERAMQRERERVNAKWMKKFASLAEAKGLNVYELDPVKLVNMVAMEPKDFKLDGMSDNGDRTAESADGHGGKVGESGNKPDVQVKGSVDEERVEP